MADPKEESIGLDRRSFLKGTGVAAAVATVPMSASPSDAAEPAAVGPQAVEITLSVDGKELKSSVEPRVTLLDALRDYLRVTTAKRVCDRGTCGACTVILDGKSVYACSLLAIECQGKKIVTARGLMQGEELSELHQAFWEKDASQCGFCTPGFISACAALRQKNPKASFEDLKRGVDGNICRCGTYEQMFQAFEQLTGGGK